MLFHYGVAGRPIQGEVVSGDTYAIVEGDGFSLFLLIDGLGHGAAAAHAAEQAREIGVAQAALPPEMLLRTMDEKLIGTRGAVASVLRLETRSRVGLVSFCGIGNVGLNFDGKHPFCPISTPGILGRRIRKVRAFEHQLTPGDTLALYTDGISSRFEINTLPEDPQRAATTLLEQHGKSTDDASCIILRWKGLS